MTHIETARAYMSSESVLSRELPKFGGDEALSVQTKERCYEDAAEFRASFEKSVREQMRLVLLLLVLLLVLLLLVLPPAADPNQQLRTLGADKVDLLTVHGLNVLKHKEWMLGKVHKDSCG